MIAAAENGFELPRWVLSAMVVIGVHAAVAMMLTRWHEPVEADGTILFIAFRDLWNR